MYKLRNYQIKGVKDCLEVVNSKKLCREVVVAPTASGKSIFTAETVKGYNKPIIVVQPTRELLIQNYLKYKSVGGEASICCASLKTRVIKKQPYTEIEGELKRVDEVSKVTYATPQSIAKLYKEFKDIGVEAVIVDECHIGTKGGTNFRKTLVEIGVKNVLGLTATPVYLESDPEKGAILKMVNKADWKLFNNIKSVVQISELVQKGYWSKIIYSEYNKIDMSILRPNKSGSKFDKDTIKLFYKENKLFDTTKKYIEKLKSDGRKSILIFVATVEQAKELSATVKGSKYVLGETESKERSETINDFKSGKLQILINVGVLTTGFDFPALSSIINSIPTMSVAMYYQIIGRGVRIFEGKEDFRYIDLAGNIERFGKVEGFTFEDIPLYGWAMLDDKDNIITDYPIKLLKKPNKKYLIKKMKDKLKGIKVDYSLKIGFGKYSKLSVQNLYDKDKQYIYWLLSNKDFDWSKRLPLKKQLESILNIC